MLSRTVPPANKANRSGSKIADKIPQLQIFGLKANQMGTFLRCTFSFVLDSKFAGAGSGSGVKMHRERRQTVIRGGGKMQKENNVTNNCWSRTVFCLCL